MNTDTQTASAKLRFAQLERRELNDVRQQRDIATAKLALCKLHADKLAEALRDTELRTTQARIASGIGKRKNQTEFLLGELERIAGAARQALAAYELSK